MKTLFKKYFVPHEGNDHRPHFLRHENALFFLSAAFFVEIVLLAQVYIVSPHTGFLASILPNVLTELTNGSREANKAPVLAPNAVLEKAAALKAADMAAKGYFAHVSPEGVTPWHWFKEAGYAYSLAGENLAVNFSDSEDVVKAWLNSPTHRENLLNKNFTEIGIGTARGIYKGRDTIFIVQLFGKPKTISLAVQVPATGGLAGTSPAEVKEPEAIAPSTAPLAVNLPAAISGVRGAAAYEEAPEVGISETAEPAAEPAVEAAAPSVAAPVAVTEKVTRDAASLGEKLVTMPRRVTNWLFFALGVIALFALLLKLFVKMHIKHPVLIANGFILVFTAGALTALNNYLLNFSASIF